MHLFSNTHIGDLKEVAVNIFEPNKSKGSIKEYGMQDACNMSTHDIIIRNTTRRNAEYAAYKKICRSADVST